MPRTSQPNKVRRTPVQARSRARVARILDATARIVAEVGFEDASIERIAGKARTSVGSIYQFYPDKLALFRAMVTRHMDQTIAMVDEVLSVWPWSQAWEGLVETLIDGMAAWAQEEPAIKTVWLTAYVNRDIVEESERFDREIARRIESILARYNPALPARRRAIVARAMVEVFGTMLLLTARVPRNEGKAMLEETRHIIIRYLRPELTRVAPR